MKKLLIKFISLVLILVMSALMMFSCEQIQQGWDINPEDSENKDEVEKAENDSTVTENSNNGDQPNETDKPDNDDQSNGTDGVDDYQELPLPGYGFVSMFPDDWTGGFPRQGGVDIEYCWVETYDELVVAIEKLKSHGSTFLSDAECLVNYDGPLFDVKYCIEICDTGKTESIIFGEDPFDRYAEKVCITCWGFLEEVTIEEINYGYVERMESFRLLTYDSFGDWYAEYNDNVSKTKYQSTFYSDRINFKLEDSDQDVFGIDMYCTEQLYDEEMIFQTVLSNIGCLELSDEVGIDVEYCWVETYDELLVAIEKLKSHGSTFADDVECIVDYDGHLFDVKYCIKIYNRKGTEDVNLGEDPFDKCAEKVYISCWGFLEEVTIEEINCGYVDDMQSFEVYAYDSFSDLYEEYGDDILNLKYYNVSFTLNRDLLRVVFYLEESHEKMFGIRTYFDVQSYDKKSIINTVFDNIKCLKLNNKE